MDKARLHITIIEKIGAELETLTRAALMARDEATHEESKPENQYDMHAQEAAYLAEGQARLAAELNETLKLYQALPVVAWDSSAPVGIGAVVTLEASLKTARYFIGPRSGGLELDLDGEAITVVTPASPLGRQLVGAKLNSTVHLPGRGAPVPYRVIRIE
jgi:transcription elongation GreA/GreB family factor